MEVQHSPYQAPQSSFNLEPAHHERLVRATKGQRFINYIVDLIGYMALSVLVGAFIGLIFGEAGIAYLESTPDVVFGFLIYFAYYVGMESLNGRTLGKLVTGTRAVNENGASLTFGQILGRTALRFIPFEPFSFLGAEGRGWHDSLSKTYVVKCR